jgi:hypothetical protein
MTERKPALTPFDKPLRTNEREDAGRPAPRRGAPVTGAEIAAWAVAGLGLVVFLIATFSPVGFDTGAIAAASAWAAIGLQVGAAAAGAGIILTGIRQLLPSLGPLIRGE